MMQYTGAVIRGGSLMLDGDAQQNWTAALNELNLTMLQEET